MKKPSLTIINLTLTFLLLTACNLPVEQVPPPSDVQTAAALTVEALLSTPTVQVAQEVLSTVESTPTYSPPMASFEGVTNCRTGPGINYERVTQLRQFEPVQIIGYYPPNYWVVSTTAGPCWVSGEFVTPSGSYQIVPTVTAPPTSTSSALGKVSMQKWNVACDYAANRADITLTWKDVDGESGYRILRNGEIIAELPVDSVQFNESITLLSGQSVGYNVIAFSVNESDTSSLITLTC